MSLQMALIELSAHPEIKAIPLLFVPDLISVDNLNLRGVGGFAPRDVLIRSGPGEGPVEMLLAGAGG